MRFLGGVFFGRCSIGAAIVCATLASGCASLVGEETEDATIPMQGNDLHGKPFSYTTTTTISADATSANSATLLNLSLQTTTEKDLTFMNSLKVDLSSPSQTVEAASMPSFPKGQPIVNIPIEYKGDLIPFFSADGHTIAVTWTGGVDPTFAWPDSGVPIEVHLTINVQ